MTYWAPTQAPKSDGFNASSMPWYCQFDWLEVYTWEESTNTFVLDWRDDFTGENGASVANDKLAVWDNVPSGSNDRTEKISSAVYIFDNTMTIQMSGSKSQIWPGTTTPQPKSEEFLQ